MSFTASVCNKLPARPREASFYFNVFNIYKITDVVSTLLAKRVLTSLMGVVDSAANRIPDNVSRNVLDVDLRGKSPVVPLPRGPTLLYLFCFILSFFLSFLFIF